VIANFVTYVKFSFFIRRLIQREDYSGALFIIGAQKAGTTALHAYIKSHPKILPPYIKEPAFFNRDKVFAKGFAYYRSHFAPFANGRMLLDSSPGYIYYRSCAQRIKDAFPEARIVCLLREPVSRAFSGFNMYQQIFHTKFFRERIENANSAWHEFLAEAFRKDSPPSIEDFLSREMEIIQAGEDCEEPSLIRRGIYAPQIERYVGLFGRDNILILFSDELKEKTSDTVARVLEFAGLEPLEPMDFTLKHVREYTADPSGKEIIRSYAGELFEQDKRELIDKYHLDVPW